MDLISIIESANDASISRRLSPNPDENQIDQQYDEFNHTADDGTVKSNPSEKGTIYKRIDESSNETTIDNQYDSNNESHEATTASVDTMTEQVQSNLNKTPIERAPVPASTNEGANPKHIDHTQANPVKDDAKSILASHTDTKQVNKSEKGSVSSTLIASDIDSNKTEWDLWLEKEKSKYKIEQDLMAIPANAEKFKNNFVNSMTATGSELNSYLASLANSPLQMVNGSLSTKKSHINMNVKMLGSYMADLTNLLPGSAPYYQLPWAKYLDFMKYVPKFTEISSALTDIAKKMLLKKLENKNKNLDPKTKSDRLEKVEGNTVKPTSSTKVAKANKDYNKSTDTQDMSKVIIPNSDSLSGEGHGDQLLIDISNESKWSERYEKNDDNHLGPYFKGFADISMFEGRIDRFYDFEIYAPSALKNKGLPQVPKSSTGLFVDKASEINQISLIKLTSGETINLGDFGSPIKTIKLTEGVASISTDIYETEDISVRKWLQDYLKYMYGDNPLPLVHRSIYLGYYYITFYYLDHDRSIIQERTFYGVPKFDLSLTPESSSFKKFTIDWDIIGESPTREE